jgi:hypothetical protein
MDLILIIGGAAAGLIALLLALLVFMCYREGRRPKSWRPRCTL